MHYSRYTSASRQLSNTTKAIFQMSVTRCCSCMCILCLCVCASLYLHMPACAWLQVGNVWMVMLVWLPLCVCVCVRDGSCCHPAGLTVVKDSKAVCVTGPLSLPFLVLFYFSLMGFISLSAGSLPPPPFPLSFPLHSLLPHFLSLDTLQAAFGEQQRARDPLPAIIMW